MLPFMAAPAFAACNTCVVATGNKTVDVWADGKMVFQFTPGGIVFNVPVIKNGTVNPFGGFAPLESPTFTGNVSVPDQPVTGAGGSFALNANSANLYYAPLNGAHLSNSPTTNDVSAGTATTEIMNANSVRAYYAPLNSPQLTGNPTSPTPSPQNRSAQIATTEYALPRSEFGMGSPGGSISTVNVGENIISSYSFNLDVDSNVSVVASFAVQGSVPATLSGCVANVYITGISGKNSIPLYQAAVIPINYELSAGSHTLTQSVTCSNTSTAASAYWSSALFISAPI